ncbi:DedA family protein [Georgenia sp. AZ-5]|uniref:DedA family protein n=1 Tax=Georgenia sp. AZ-5 TaxID=3367526 RepID=UPI003754863D
MPDFLASWPFWLVFAFLYLGATLRGQAIYWLGRVVTEQTLRHSHPAAGWRLRAYRWLQGEGTARGIEALRRWGLVAVPFAYLTVGFQSMVMAGAGVLRIGWVRFSAAQVPGALAWAVIYSTIGFAVWEAALAAAAGSPRGIAGIGALAVVIAATVVVHRRRHAAAVSGLPAGRQAAHDGAARTTGTARRDG